MNALVAPKPPLAELTRWTRHAEFLVYLVPVGTISAELYEGYVQLLRANRVIAIRSLTRPGGYAAELSPFRSFAWDGAGAMRFRFVSTTDKIDAFDGEDVHACARAIGVIGICHCPTTPSLSAAYQQFMDSIRHFPGLLVQKCFAFEHQFDLRTVDECASLSHLVMFPVYHELSDEGRDGRSGGMSTVSLHLEVVLDTLCVTILMSLESTLRAATRQQQTQMQSSAGSGSSAFPGAIEMGDAAGFLLDTNVEPSHINMQHTSGSLSPFPARESLTHSGASTPTHDRSMAQSSGGGVAALFGSAETRNRRRHAARQRKLFGDYAVLVSCLPDAVDHYVAAIELLRDEERKSSGASGDVLWLAAALEGYVFCLYQQSQDKFMVELVEKTSEALVLYAKAGVSELEIALVEHIGWYYTAVALQLSASKGLEKVEEAIWVKRLLWEAIERGVSVFSDIPIQRQVAFLIQSASMVEAVGHHRRMALFLHEAVALILQRWRSPTSGSSSFVTSPGSQTSLPQQRSQDFRAALRLELITATRLGMAERVEWEMTSLRRRGRRLRRLQKKGAATKVTLAMAAQSVEPWLVLRFHVLRQLVALSKALGDPFLVGKHCIQLLQVLSWCDRIAMTTSTTTTTHTSDATGHVEQPQTPFSAKPSMASSSSLSSSGANSTRPGLHVKPGNANSTAASGGFASVYTTPPASIETKTKRYFSMANSPSATMSSAAASITSTIANTPRALLSTPRQQLSAAVNAISTKATPAFSSFSNAHNSHNSHSHSSPSSTGLNRSSSASTVTDLMSTTSGASGTSTNSFHAGSSRSSGMAVGDQPMLDLQSRGGGGGGSTTGENSATSGATTTMMMGADGFPTPVWDLRSRVEIHRLERRVLSQLEAECAVMRPSEQIKLDAFVHVDRMKLLYDAVDHPLVKKEVVAKKYGLVRGGASAAVAASPAFFYNPFDDQNKNKAKASQSNKSKRRITSDSDSNRHSDGSDSDSDSDKEDKDTVAEYERSFPVHERVQIQVTLSNPFGIELDLQQVALWVVASSGGGGELSTTSTSTGSSSVSCSVEAYPSSVVLRAYEKRKKILLSVRGLRAGHFQICGCFIKTLNIKTSFTLKARIPLEIVAPQPLLSSSLVEIGSLAAEETSSSSTSSTATTISRSNSIVAHGRSSRGGGNDEKEATSSSPICMFANETKRCVLHVHNTGHRAVKSLHILLRTAKGNNTRLSSPYKTLFRSPPASCGSTTPHKDGGAEAQSLSTVEMDDVAFKCLVTSHSLASLLPLERGDRLAIPFEVCLVSSAIRSSTSTSTATRMQQLQWTFVYSSDDPDDPPTIGAVPATIALVVVPERMPSSLFRESQHLVTLVSLGSLLIHSVEIVAKSSSWASSGGGAGGSTTTLSRRRRLCDHAHCIVMVQVTNPTETVFLLRMKQKQGGEKAVTGSETSWGDVELGRQSSRWLALELPRLSVEQAQKENEKERGGVALATLLLVDLLNSQLEIQWKTYFGTTGCLLFHESLWSSDPEDAKTIKKQLIQSEISFSITVESGLVVRQEPTHEDSKSPLPSEFPFRFYQPVMLQQATTTIPTDFVARVFEACELSFHVERQRDQLGDLDAEIVVRRERDREQDPVGEEGRDDHQEEEGDVAVLLAGQVKKTLTHASAGGAWRVQCVFLSEGRFEVALRARETADPESEWIWMHSPLRIESCCQAKSELDPY